MISKLKYKILNKTFTTGIIGLGYVGLPLFLEFSKKKLDVYGFDVDLNLLNSLKNKKSHITEISNNDLKNIHRDRFIDLTKNASKIHECDAIIFCLPTPIKKNKNPDMSYIKRAFEKIKMYLRLEQIIILESTVYPGATEDIFLKFITKNFQLGKNYYLSYSPERVDPGTKRKIKYYNITKVVSGYSNNCLVNARNLYKHIFNKIFIANSIKVAEFAKCFENTYRSININLVNQMKIISHKIGLDFFHVLEVSKSKPFGFVPFMPGPGIGGHCIPIDPLFLSWIAKKEKVSSSLIDASYKINSEMPKWIFNKISKEISKKEKSIILGITYKKDVNDLRESSSLEVFKLLKNDNFKLDFYDPYISSFKVQQKSYKGIKNFSYLKLKKYKNIILLTDHTIFKYDKILKYSFRIFDARGAFLAYKSSKVVPC